ncbi:hypothetical protein Tco_0511449 [Tanacetum coccineum]
MVGGAEIPQTRTSSRVRSTEEMDIAINDLNSKFASMSTVLEEIRSAIIGGGNHPNHMGNERGIHRYRTNFEGFYDNHGHNQTPKQVWRHDHMMCLDNDDGEETMDEYNKGPRRGDRPRTMVGQNVNPRGYSERYVEEWELGGNVNKITEEHKYHTCVQGKRTVVDYTSEFLRLQARCNLREMDKQSAARCSNMESLSNYESRPNPIQSTIPSTTTTTSSSKASRSRVDKNKESQPVNSNPYARPTESGNDRLFSDNAFQEEDELEYAEPLYREAEQVIQDLAILQEPQELFDPIEA